MRSTVPTFMSKAHAQVSHWLLLPALCLLLSGCFMAPFIGAFKQAGVTRSDREALLPKEVKRFNDALFWGNSGPIMSMVDESAREEIGNQVAEASDVERVVESKVLKVSYDEDAYEADVQVKVRFYRVPYYMVRDRVEHQRWKFSFNDGWQISARSLDEKLPAKDESVSAG